MRHRRKGRKLGRDASHRKALFSNMAASLFEHGRIRTTEAKAKELRPIAEKLITLARKDPMRRGRAAAGGRLPAQQGLRPQAVPRGRARASPSGRAATRASSSSARGWATPRRWPTSSSSTTSRPRARSVALDLPAGLGRSLGADATSAPTTGEGSPSLVVTTRRPSTAAPTLARYCAPMQDAAVRAGSEGIDLLEDRETTVAGHPAGAAHLPLALRRPRRCASACGACWSTRSATRSSPRRRTPPSTSCARTFAAAPAALPPSALAGLSAPARDGGLRRHRGTRRLGAAQPRACPTVSAACRRAAGRRPICAWPAAPTAGVHARRRTWSRSTPRGCRRARRQQQAAARDDRRCATWRPGGPDGFDAARRRARRGATSTGSRPRPRPTRPTRLRAAPGAADGRRSRWRPCAARDRRPARLPRVHAQAETQHVFFERTVLAAAWCRDGARARVPDHRRRASCATWCGCCAGHRCCRNPRPGALPAAAGGRGRGRIAGSAIARRSVADAVRASDMRLR